MQQQYCWLCRQCRCRSISVDRVQGTREICIIFLSQVGKERMLLFILLLLPGLVLLTCLSLASSFIRTYFQWTFLGLVDNKYVYCELVQQQELRQKQFSWFFLQRMKVNCGLCILTGVVVGESRKSSQVLSAWSLAWPGHVQKLTIMIICRACMHYHSL